MLSHFIPVVLKMVSNVSWFKSDQPYSEYFECHLFSSKTTCCDDWVKLLVSLSIVDTMLKWC